MKTFKKIITFILEIEARLVLWRYKPKIAAVTGSVGKTTTKDALYTVLATKYFTRKSEKSFNSDIGVPLTILGCPNGWHNPLIWLTNVVRGLSLLIFKQKYPQWLVLEIGADRPGDIKKLCRYIKPDIAIVTRIGAIPVHVEFFPSRKSLVEEKSQLPQALKEGGTLVLSADDVDVSSFKVYSKGKLLMYSFEGVGDLRGSHFTVLYDAQRKPIGISFRVDWNGNSVPVRRLGVLGKHHVYPSLAALCTAAATEISFVKAAEALSDDITPPGRMRILEGLRGCVIVDDTYNASPVATEEALNALSGLEIKGKKIAVLGDMLELGKQSVAEHQRIGHIATQSAQIIVTVGMRAKVIAQQARELKPELLVNSFDYAEQAGIYLQNLVESGDVVLIKGSQGVRMEKTVEKILANPNNKENLLVRQEKEWQKR